ncbi:hypothetical protein QU487_02505 [Crenobacter sp. SG2305]|uniref:hypothetical protein n=1 Tax=Crenobacter oryzisoli TaxID=3056844 RepID=UPI0025AA8D13|nr:hypothetical protein [Crenobacter sp. SG2305]MDN0081632.1 hypothetical protein [Crenobacter sp. SG2305]
MEQHLGGQTALRSTFDRAGYVTKYLHKTFGYKGQVIGYMAKYLMTCSSDQELAAAIKEMKVLPSYRALAARNRLS